jgi:hypothetical protein
MAPAGGYCRDEALCSGAQRLDRVQAVPALLGHDELDAGDAGQVLALAQRDQLAASGAAAGAGRPASWPRRPVRSRRNTMPR